ncbi:MAG: LysM peptidoglycan-binding domain-containing protein [Alphaproteobacteria bacterium]
MSDQQAGGTTAKKLIIPAVLLFLAILVFLGWRGVFSPAPTGAPGTMRAPVAESPSGGAALGNAGKAARPTIPAAPTPPGLTAPSNEPARAEANAAAPNSAQANMVPPRFDVVRVGARGSAVIAGRAAPGAEVILLADNGRELGRARADRRGEFVILPADSLPPGTMELSLRARLGDQEVIGPDTVVLVVPDTAAQIAETPRPLAPAQPAPATPANEPTGTAPAPPGPLAVLSPSRPEGAGPRLLQVPEPAPADRTAPRLGIDSVEYDQAGSMRFAGGAPPGTTLRLYVDDRHIGDAVADALGRWALMPENQPSIGRHRLRVDQISPADGRVLARAEVPFQREDLPAEAFSQQRIVVQPGNNLWRIARATYGRGTRYTVIYQANKDQIADPNRIFPGQVFALPIAQPAPAASRRSRLGTSARTNRTSAAIKSVELVGGTSARAASKRILWSGVRPICQPSGRPGVSAARVAKLVWRWSRPSAVEGMRAASVSTANPSALSSARQRRPRQSKVNSRGRSASLGARRPSGSMASWPRVITSIGRMFVQFW